MNDPNFASLPGTRLSYIFVAHRNWTDPVIKHAFDTVDFAIAVNTDPGFIADIQSTGSPSLLMTEYEGVNQFGGQKYGFKIIIYSNEEPKHQYKFTLHKTEMYLPTSIEITKF